MNAARIVGQIKEGVDTLSGHLAELIRISKGDSTKNYKAQIDEAIDSLSGVSKNTDDVEKLLNDVIKSEAQSNSDSRLLVRDLNITLSKLTDIDENTDDTELLLNRIITNMEKTEKTSATPLNLGQRCAGTDKEKPSFISVIIFYDENGEYIKNAYVDDKGKPVHEKSLTFLDDAECACKDC